MRTQQIQTKVTIFGRECEITIFMVEKGQDKWRAYGYYEDQYIETHWSRTCEKAIDNWKRKAKMYADY